MSPEAKKFAKNHRLKDILAYEQNTLDPPERAALEAHVKTCPDCQEVLGRARRFLARFQPPPR